jgi:hypothetical protein
MAPLAALCLLLPGCIGTAAATATQSLTSAEQAAHAWDPGAQLAQAIGLEGTYPMMAALMGAATRSGDFEKAKDDKSVGDGRCEAWLYRFVAPDKESAYVVVVDSDGKVLRQAEDAKREGDVALAAWSVDSDAALAAAKTASPALAKGIAAKDFGIASVLRSGEGARPEWFIIGGGGDASSGGGGFARIDATTGRALDAQGGFSPF